MFKHTLVQQLVKQELRPRGLKSSPSFPTPGSGQQLCSSTNGAEKEAPCFKAGTPHSSPPFFTCHLIMDWPLLWTSVWTHKIVKTGIPTVGQWNQWCLWSSGMQVQSPAWHSGLRIWHCCSFSLILNSSLDLIPGPGSACAEGWPKMKTKQQKKIHLYHFFRYHI